MLVDIDFSCYDKNPKPDTSPELSIRTSQQQEQEDKKVDGTKIEYNDHEETPLLLAAAKGIIELVERILTVHPNAVDYVTAQDRNILHVIIAHRQKKVFNWIKDKKLIMDRLVKRMDVNGFTVLHHVGIINFIHQSAHGPALELQNELMWFDDVYNEIPSLYKMHYSRTGQKPREYFDAIHNDMLKDGKEWIKKTSEACSTVAVLMATVSFAAAFTVPGGVNRKTGTPVLVSDPIYMWFTIMDISSLITSLSALVMFLLILTSPFRMDDFRQTLPVQLSTGFNLLFLSVTSTMFSFALAVILTLKSSNMIWAETLLYSVTLVPVTIFAISKLQLLRELGSNIWHCLQTISQILPMGFINPSSKKPSKFKSKKST